jgi:RNA polymerase sigma-70 factor (ECF subfamily)
VAAFDGWDNLDRYWAYLRVRARRLNLNPRLKMRFSESDLVQEAFIRAQSTAEPCRDKSPRARMAYLDQAFDWTFQDHLRKHHAERRDIDREKVVQQALNESTAAYHLDFADNGASPSEQANRREQFLGAMEAVNELPERERDVIFLVYFEHCSLQEAGDRLEMTKGTAAGLYGRGVTRLRGKLNPGVEDGHE